MQRITHLTAAVTTLAAGALLSAAPAQGAVTPVFDYKFGQGQSYNGSGTAVDDLSSADNDATLDTSDVSLADDRPSGFSSSLKSLDGPLGGSTGTDNLGGSGDTDNSALLPNSCLFGNSHFLARVRVIPALPGGDWSRCRAG